MTWLKRGPRSLPVADSIEPQPAAALPVADSIEARHAERKALERAAMLDGVDSEMIPASGNAGQPPLEDN